MRCEAKDRGENYCTFAQALSLFAAMNQEVIDLEESTSFAPLDDAAGFSAERLLELASKFGDPEVAAQIRARSKAQDIRLPKQSDARADFLARQNKLEVIAGSSKILINMPDTEAAAAAAPPAARPRAVSDIPEEPRSRGATPATPAPAPTPTPTPPAASAASAAAGPAPRVDVPTFAPDELEAVKAVQTFAQFGPAHERGLAYMRWRRDDAVASVHAGRAPTAEFASDTRLLRFLIACGWDAQAAGDMYVAALAWRYEHGMDAVRDRVVALNRAFFEQGAEALAEVFVGEHDAAVQAVQPRTFARPLAGGGGGYAPLLDKEGNLVYIECPGMVDNAGIAALGTGAWAESYLGGVELGILLIDELSRRQRRLVLMFRCMDMTGIKIIKAFQSKQEKEGEAAFKEYSGMASKVPPQPTALPPRSPSMLLCPPHTPPTDDSPRRESPWAVRSGGARGVNVPTSAAPKH